MAKRVSFNALRDDDILNFPLDVEFDLPEIADSFYDDVARRICKSDNTEATSNTGESELQTMNESSSSSSGSFYDIDNMSLSLIPFDVEQEEEVWAGSTWYFHIHLPDLLVYSIAF